MAANDPTLEEIRARRMAELQAQYGGGVSLESQWSVCVARSLDENIFNVHHLA